MTKISPEIEELKRLTEEKYGMTLATTTDFECFSITIKRHTSQNISASTLKRMWGYVSDKHKPRIYTLDILSQYLGYTNYTAFVNWLKTSTKYNSSFFNAMQLVSSELTPGTTVEIGWSPNRLVHLQYLGNSKYEVIDASNSKLRPGDKFTTGCFIKEQPLYLPYIERPDGRTPAFVAGRNGGLTIINITYKNE